MWIAIQIDKYSHIIFKVVEGVRVIITTYRR